MFSVPTLSIRVNLSMLTNEAIDMINRMPNTSYDSMLRNASPNGSVAFVVRGCSHTRPTVRVKSLLPDSERIRKFGIEGGGLNGHKDIESLIAGRVRCYGDNYSMSRWTLPTNGVQFAGESPDNGAEWINKKAIELADWCLKGQWELID